MKLLLALALLGAVFVADASVMRRGRGRREIEAKAAVMDELESKSRDLKDNCFPMPEGCRCSITLDDGEVETQRFRTEEEEEANCFKPSEEAKTVKASVLNELEQKSRDLKDNCFPMPKGCRCTVTGDDGEETTSRFKTKEEEEANCFKPSAAAKAAVLGELEAKSRDLKDNCFPMPKGCRCSVTGADGEETTSRFKTKEEEEANCYKDASSSSSSSSSEEGEDGEKSSSSSSSSESAEKDGQSSSSSSSSEEEPTAAPAPSRRRRDQSHSHSTEVGHVHGASHEGHGHGNTKHGTHASHEAHAGHDHGDATVRRTHDNHKKVMQELKDKTAGFREGCFPRPVGCSCSTDPEGNEVDPKTSGRYRGDNEFKCREAEDEDLFFFF